MKNTKIIILATALLIIFFGIISIYSSNYQKEGQLWQSIYKRQLIWAFIGIALFFAMSKFSYRYLWQATYFLYFLAIVLLCLVVMLGITRMGAQRWLKFFWLNFQPSELSKLIMVVFLARYFSTKSIYKLSLPVREFRLWRGFALPFIFIAIPAGLVIEQPDLGTGVIIILIFLFLAYLSGVKLRYILGFLLGQALLCPLLWQLLREYQRQRLLVFLNPNIDPLGAGYTIIQSKIAIGSGGIFGKGWLSGTQSQLHFLPESHTDFIFATFAEEWGFFGCTILLLLYYFLIREGIRIALKTNDSFGRLLAFGISLVLAVQVFINISMNLGLAPVVGIPLPLMSYGGSSLFVTMISLGILVNIDRERAVF